MKTFKGLMIAINKNLSLNIRAFLEYKIIRNLGQGEQGIVFLIENEIGRKFALKLFNPRAENVLADFNLEIEILMDLRHGNIGAIYTAGIATWNTEEGKWYITQTKRVGEIMHAEGQIACLFYVMDYLDGSLPGIFPPMRDRRRKIREEKQLTELAEQFEELAAQISEAIKVFHEKGVIHKDIKQTNIRYSTEDKTFVIVDFGFGRHTRSSGQDKSEIHRKEIEDFRAIEAGDYKKSDIFQFARVLETIFSFVQPAYDPYSAEGISRVLSRAQGELNNRYESALEFEDALTSYFRFSKRRKWRLSLSPHEYLAPEFFGRLDFRVRIPVSGSVYFSKEVKNLIDTAEFQRLRGVRQLGPTMYVFPGAYHTRFEHSLGTYWTALRYLERLSKQPLFRDALKPVEQTVKLIVIAALLHDIGHYPYSHWIEEIAVFPRRLRFDSHEKRAREIIFSSRIKAIIENVWNLDPNMVCQIIDGNVGSDASLEMAISFINSAVDVDKIDYLIRDSLHCGVVYGNSIDLDRLLESLHIREGHNRICLNEKGKSVLPTIIAARNAMYQEVYWHKAVRSCQSMFKRFIYELISEERLPKTRALELFQLPDDEFVSELYSLGRGTRNLSKLIAPFAHFSKRSIYKTVFSISRYKAEKNLSGIKKFFASVREAPYPQLVILNQRLLAAIRSIPKYHNIDEFDILLDKAPIKKGDKISVEEVGIINPITNNLEEFPSEVKNMSDYLETMQQSYIFCNPRLHERLSQIKVGDWNAILSEIS
jgi:HD superfamily phosphohydrolase